VPFDPLLPSLSESALDAILGRMTANLAALNTALLQAPLSVGVATAAQFFIGDPIAMPDNVDFWVTVRPGDDAGAEITTEVIYAADGGNGGYRNSYQATISIYCHPDAVFDPSPFVNESLRTRLLSRVEDWVRIGVFNTRSNATGQDGVLIPLGSREYAVSPSFDKLIYSMVSDFKRGLAEKNPGGTAIVDCARCIFSAYLQ
jgi:hypothetical protein